MKFDPIEALYRRLQAEGQVCHEAEVDGYRLYIADTSFGDGPVFRVNGNGCSAAFHWAYQGGFEPANEATTLDDLAWIAPLIEKAQWQNLLVKRQQQMGYLPPDENDGETEPTALEALEALDAGVSAQVKVALEGLLAIAASALSHEEYLADARVRAASALLDQLER